MQQSSVINILTDITGWLKENNYVIIGKHRNICSILLSGKGVLKINPIVTINEQVYNIIKKGF